MTWRDISTAPRDGTWILLFDPKMEMPASLGCYERWEDRDDKGRFKPGGWAMAEWDGLPSSCEPTHWQPLPAPPEATTEAERTAVLEGK
jgi:hypothetical protein